MFSWKRKPPIDADEFDWLLACTAWAVEILGGEAAMRAGKLILPADFPRWSATGHDRASEIFEHVKGFAGMSEWPCKLRSGASERACGHCQVDLWNLVRRVDLADWR